jgi:hypothetical protein
VLIAGLAIALVAVLLIVGGGVAYLVSRASPAEVPNAAPGQVSRPTAPTPTAPTSGNAPDIDLRFEGACAPSFGGRVMVMPSQGTITVSATQGMRLGGVLTLGLPARVVQAGSVQLGTQQRVDAPETIVHVMQDQTLWMNMARDAAGVLTSGASDPIGGRIVVRSFDGEAGTADLTFERVVLQNTQNDSLCIVNGRVRTYGQSY